MMDSPHIELNYIEVTAPIPINVLKESFKDPLVAFKIDVDNSKLPAPRILNYVANLKVQTELKFVSKDRMTEFLLAYMSSTLLYRCPELETLALVMVMHSMGIDTSSDDYTAEEMDVVVNEIGPEIIQLWRTRLSSIPAWTLHAHTQTKEMARQYPDDTITFTKDGRIDPRGINFIHVLESPLLPLWSMVIRNEDITFNKALFDDNIFAGKSMYSYLSGADNPFMLAMFDLLPPLESQHVPSS